jgi:hypothetical protein
MSALQRDTLDVDLAVTGYGNAGKPSPESASPIPQSPERPPTLYWLWTPTCSTTTRAECSCGAASKRMLSA